MMNKAALVEAVEADLAEQGFPIESHAQAWRIVNSVIGTTTETVVSGETVQISGFGSFKPVTRAAHAAMNPATRESVEVPTKKSVRFAPGAALKRAVNE